MDQPNIIWVALESVRFDHTSLGDYERGTTPNILALSEKPEAKSFDLAFSNGIYTRASTASILTGTYPSRHGLGFHQTLGELPAELSTIPELLKHKDYQTACLTPNPHMSSGSGLTRGFDDFRYFRRNHLTEAASYRSILRYILNLRRHSAGFTTETAEHSTDYLMDLEAKKLIKKYDGREDPYFLYIHHGDTHCPYSPPLPYRDEYIDDIDFTKEQSYNISHDLHANLYENLASGSDYNKQEWDGIIAMYDAAIKYTDQLVGELVSYALEVSNNTIVVITGDHGELLGEQNLIEHRLTTHDAGSHVPLVVHGSEAISNINSELVQHIDIMKTILEEDIGIESAQLQGYNLADEPRDCAIIQRGYERYRKSIERMKEFDIDLDLSQFHDAAVHAARTEHFKLNKSEVRTELFKLPNESQDVREQYPNVFDSLSNRIDSFLENEGEPLVTDMGQEEMSEEIQEHLSELGYLSS